MIDMTRTIDTNDEIGYNSHTDTTFKLSDYIDTNAPKRDQLLAIEDIKNEYYDVLNAVNDYNNNSKIKKGISIYQHTLGILGSLVCMGFGYVIKAPDSFILTFVYIIAFFLAALKMRITHYNNTFKADLKRLEELEPILEDIYDELLDHKRGLTL
jgi:hypothetical protein